MRHGPNYHHMWGKKMIVFSILGPSRLKQYSATWPKYHIKLYDLKKISTGRCGCFDDDRD